MAEITPTPIVEATPVGGETTHVKPTPLVEAKETIITQAQLDAQMGQTRRATELETERKLLASLGLKPEDKEKLTAIRTAYESGLSETEKLTNQVSLLQTQINTLNQQLEEKEYLISALSTKTGVELSSVETIVKMAKGLRSDTVTIEDAIKTVISYTAPVQTPIAQVPSGTPLNNPNTPPIAPINPFRPDQQNLTEQGRIYRENPDKARQLAREAGITLDF